MKRIISLCLALLMIISAVPFAAAESADVYDGNGFCILPEDFASLYDKALGSFDDGNIRLDRTKTGYLEGNLCSDLKWKGTRMTSLNIECAQLSFDGCENPDAPMTQVAVVYDANHFLTNYTSWRETVIHLYAALPLAIDSTIDSAETAVALVEKIFANATGGRDIHNTATKTLDQKVSVYEYNGVTYTLALIDNSIRLIATVNRDAIISEGRPLAAKNGHLCVTEAEFAEMYAAVLNDGYGFFDLDTKFELVKGESLYSLFLEDIYTGYVYSGMVKGDMPAEDENIDYALVYCMYNGSNIDSDTATTLLLVSGMTMLYLVDESITTSEEAKNAYMAYYAQTALTDEYVWLDCCGLEFTTNIISYNGFSMMMVGVREKGVY